MTQKKDLVVKEISRRLNKFVENLHCDQTGISGYFCGNFNISCIDGPSEGKAFSIEDLKPHEISLPIKKVLQFIGVQEVVWRNSGLMYFFFRGYYFGISSPDLPCDQARIFACVCTEAVSEKERIRISLG